MGRSEASIAWWFIRKYIDIRLVDVFNACRKSAVVALCTAAPAVGIVAIEGFPSGIPFPLFIAAARASGRSR